MSLYWVNWIYMHDGKACHGFWSESEISLERAIKGVEWLKEHTENLVCAWINRSEEQADGNHKNVGTPYLEAFVDAFGYPAREALKVMDECNEPSKQEAIKMNANALWDMYRKAARKLHTLEQRHKAELEAGKEYASLTYTEMNIQCGVLQGVHECLATVEPDKYATGKRCFEIWCEETDVPKVKGGKFGFWIPVEQELPEQGMDVLVCYADGALDIYSEWHNCVAQYVSDEIIAWMPLPEAYKPDKGGDAEESAAL